tara:strand:- start:1107 stop:1286 length:180 start_codon:yes stop_codon:yes gene_type:complete
MFELTDKEKEMSLEEFKAKYFEPMNEKPIEIEVKYVIGQVWESGIFVGHEWVRTEKIKD